VSHLLRKFFRKILVKLCPPFQLHSVHLSLGRGIQCSVLIPVSRSVELRGRNDVVVNLGERKSENNFLGALNVRTLT